MLEVPGFQDNDTVQRAYAAVSAAASEVIAQAKGNARTARRLLAARAQADKGLRASLITSAIVRACKVASQDWQAR